MENAKIEVCERQCKADGLCGCLCLICMVSGLVAAIFEHLTLTIFFSAMVIALALQPDEDGKHEMDKRAG